MELPVMPVLKDFPAGFDSNAYNTHAFKEALNAWERVCKEIIAADCAYRDPELADGWMGEVE